jgi:hypothetical protein
VPLVSQLIRTSEVNLWHFATMFILWSDYISYMFHYVVCTQKFFLYLGIITAALLTTGKNVIREKYCEIALNPPYFSGR